MNNYLNAINIVNFIKFRIIVKLTNSKFKSQNTIRLKVDSESDINAHSSVN